MFMKILKKNFPLVFLFFSFFQMFFLYLRNSISREYTLRAKLENRYRKSAIIYDVEGRRIGRVWQIDENYPIFWDKKDWVSRFDAANTITEVIERIACT